MPENVTSCTDGWGLDVSGGDGRLKKRLDTYAARSSLGTVVFMKEAGHWWYRIFWICIFLGGMAATIYNVQMLLVLYFSFQVNTQVSLGYAKLDFPTVTICNINPIRQSMLDQYGTPEMKNFVAQLKPTNSYKFDIRANQSAGSTQVYTGSTDEPTTDIDSSTSQPASTVILPTTTGTQPTSTGRPTLPTTTSIPQTPNDIHSTSASILSSSASANKRKKVRLP